MNNKGQLSWEMIVLVPIGLFIMYLMFFIATPFIDLLFPILDNTENFPLGWLVKLVIQLLPLIVVSLLILRIKRTADRSEFRQI